MNLAMGLQAADEYFREGDRRKVREYQQALRDSEMSLLPDRAESLRSGYRDTTETNAARAKMRPGQTDLSMAQTGLDQANVSSATARQPMESETAATNAAAANSTAKFSLSQLPVNQQTATNNNALAKSNSEASLAQAPDVQAASASMAKVNAAVAGEKANQIPQMLSSMKVKGALSGEEERDAILSTLARRLRSNDATGSLEFANQIAQIPGIMPSTNGKVFTSIQAVTDGTDASGQKGPGYVFKTQDGQQAFITSKTMVDAYQRTLGNPKFGFLHDKDTGEVIRTNPQTGEAAVVREAQPGRVRGVDKMPSDQKMIQFYMANGMDFAQASKKIGTQKEPGRLAFIAKRLELIPSPTEADVEKASNLYEMSQGEKRPAAPSNSAAPSKVDPRLNSLLGIPQ